MLPFHLAMFVLPAGILLLAWWLARPPRDRGR
jgi:hypothetical protein